MTIQLSKLPKQVQFIILGLQVRKLGFQAQFLTSVYIDGIQYEATTTEENVLVRVDSNSIAAANARAQIQGMEMILSDKFNERSYLERQIDANALKGADEAIPVIESKLAQVEEDINSAIERIEQLKQEAKPQVVTYEFPIN